MRIFISHSSADKKFVRKLKDDLKENDFETWVDEDELNLGDTLSEKLDEALEGSSHFIVVLSQAAIKSEWVQYELQKALKQNDSLVNRKIIPVKYKECEVPSELSKLLFWDLSSDIREVHGDKVQFTSAGYLSFLDKLCKSIRGSEKRLTQADKEELRKEMKVEPIQEASNTVRKIIRASYLVIGYRSPEVRDRYISNVLESSPMTLIKSEIRPILLPPLLKFVLPRLRIGDKVLFSKYFLGNEFGHFAGFRKDDLAIVMDYNVRKNIVVKKGYRYSVEIDTEEIRFNFMNR
ncbi:MAG TPA: toll/interleukin-1 receptor domain-containing protein [Cyclobacteriaceae bacterium]|nr:toll/interleukin-1 receptor domain-containing protein [Cyclobacteriaceae bacterium]